MTAEVFHTQSAASYAEILPQDMQLFFKNQRKSHKVELYPGDLVRKTAFRAFQRTRSRP